MTPSEIPTYSAEEVRRRLASDLPSWTYDGGWIRRDVPARSWAGALLLAGRLAYLAEAARHHPDLDVAADGVRIRIRHHWAAGITESDFELARAIEEVVAGLPAGPEAG